MSPALAAVLQVAVLALVLALAHRPLGDYMARTFVSTKDLAVERVSYRVVGVDPRSEQPWRTYLRGVLAISLVGIVVVYVLQRTQSVLPYALGMPPVDPDLAFNTAVSFVTNTNWQAYSPDVSLGYVVQMVGLAVQNFISAAVGIAVAVALVRGFARRRSGTLGNVWVDVTRTIVRILLPLSVVAALVMVLGGVIQNFAGFTDVSTVAGGSQSIPGGPVASQEAIKLLGTNGGGIFNANSSHPFENPSSWVSLFQVALFLLIPFSLPRTFGTMVGDTRQGRTILAVMVGIFTVALAAATILEMRGAGTAPSSRAARWRARSSASASRDRRSTPSPPR
ncbi:hypothetical protein GCM10025875_29980 [Litorihabitans aurantiacus]|uniref:Potassium-transporting ATPase subunit A n=1 Tax=Litorihabitans aurantiacus TaxID=1930061 RepID=A0AA37XH65_9MICO|nr:hypothetical protein GCM10025875_29980 [Litorihabitans aurantiacus]